MNTYPITPNRWGANVVSNATLDAPDLEVRRIMQKRNDGVTLSDREYRRLARRQGVEAETARTGGTMLGTIQPRRILPYDMGRQRAEQDAGYFDGRQSISRPGPAPVPVANPPMPSASIGSTTGATGSGVPAAEAPFGDAAPPAAPRTATPSPTLDAPSAPLPPVASSPNPNRWGVGRGPRYNYGRLSAPRDDINDQGEALVDVATRVFNQDPGDASGNHLRAKQIIQARRDRAR